jgi:hypothetical protein
MKNMEETLDALIFRGDDLVPTARSIHRLAGICIKAEGGHVNSAIKIL